MKKVGDKGDAQSEIFSDSATKKDKAAEDFLIEHAKTDGSKLLQGGKSALTDLYVNTKGDEKIKSDLGEFLVLQQYAPNTQGEQKQLKKLYLESVSETLYQEMVGLENEAKTTKMESGGELSKKKTALYDTLGETQDKLGDIIPELEQQDENDDQLISAKDKKKFTKFKKEMLNFIARITGISKKILKKSIEANMVDKLNKSRWDVINTDIVADDKNYTSTQIPASKMQCNLDNDVKPIFTDYGRGGISSLDTKNTDHATNLWSSKLVHKGKELFSALRFGVCCPYGIKNPQKLQDGAQNKAKEVLVASLAQNELIQQAVNAGNNDGTPPTLEICSISLLTTGLGSGKERKMQKTQNEAFKYFEGKQPVEITITDPDGKPQKVKFYLKANLMNLPVNFGGVGFASRFTSGKKAQLKQNTPVMEHFFGKKDNNTTATTGVVDKYQDKIYEELKEKTQRMVNYAQSIENSSPEEQKDISEKMTQLHYEIVKLEKKDRLIDILSKQCHDIFYSGTHYKDNDVYKLTSRMSLLAHQIGMVSMYNCKSGKDRTGMQDAETKFLAMHFDEYESIPEPGKKLTPEQKKLFAQAVLHTGNLEVQSKNVGARGYKTEHVKSIDERISDPKIRSMMRGLSTFVKG